MFTVEGYVDGVSYTAVVGDPKAEGDPSAAGIVTGTDNVVTLLRGHEGLPVRASVTSGDRPLDLRDPESVLAGLRDLTQVTKVTGDAPTTSEPYDATVVY
jgi:hypothetical protein